MNTYIPADKVIADIEQKIKNFSIMHNTAASKKDYESMSRVDPVIAQLRNVLEVVKSLQQEPRFPQYNNIVEKVFGAGNIEGFEYREAEMLVALAKEELLKSLQQEQPVNMIQWTGSNLQEVIDFTGKSPKFGEWFKSWDEFESYVHSHGDILKLFSEDGSHFEVPVGAWIVKTPDGYNVPSVARFL